MITLEEDLNKSLEKESKRLPTWLKDFLIKKIIIKAVSDYSEICSSLRRRSE
jgi:hypothetical protein